MLNNTANKQRLQEEKSGWNRRKRASRVLSESYKRLHKREDYKGYGTKASNVYSCADVIDFIADGHGGLKYHKALHCQKKLCPICGHKRSEKIYANTYKIIDYISEEKPNYKYIFLTLTIKNVPGHELSDALDNMVAGVKRLMLRKRILDINKGWMRATEVTVNYDTDEYHPHIHILMAVDERYITKKENYIEQCEFVQLWRECMRLDYDPIVYVKKVVKTKGIASDEITHAKAIAEMAKYTTKVNDYLLSWRKRDYINKEWARKGWKIRLTSRKQAEDLTDKVVKVLDKALYKRRLVSYGGIFKAAHHALNLEEPETSDLNVVDEPLQEDKDIHRYRWDRRFDSYVLVEILRYDDPRAAALPVGHDTEVLIE